MHAIGNHCYSVGNVVADTIKEEEKRALALAGTILTSQQMAQSTMGFSNHFAYHQLQRQHPSALLKGILQLAHHQLLL